MSVAVVMSLVPRRVRIMSVALYNFIITNISGLSTTLVPLLEDFYGSSHVFRIVAEPKAGELPLGNSTHTALGSRVDSLGYTSMGELSEITTVDMPSRADALHESGVEFEIPGMGSKPLQAAMLWMYPGFFLASSGELETAARCRRLLLNDLLAAAHAHHLFHDIKHTDTIFMRRVCRRAVV